MGISNLVADLGLNYLTVSLILKNVNIAMHFKFSFILRQII